jgi:hypothetical protein
MAIAVKDGKVVSAVSNIRPFMGNARPTQLITYTDAVKLLTTNNYTSLLLSPMEGAKEDVEKLYSQGKATLANAVVSEAIVAYIEELPVAAQPRLAPSYIFRGSGTLEGGKTVRFLAAVSAVPQNVLGVSDESSVLAFKNPKLGGQQQGTLEMSTASAVIVSNGDCKPSVAQLTNITTGSNGLLYGQYPYVSNSKLNTEWFYIPASGAVDINSFQQAYSAISGTAGFILRTDTGDIIADIEKNAARGCAVRLTGGSPTIFMYGPNGQTINITPVSTVTHSNTELKNDTWNVTVGKDGLTVNGTQTPYIYYEFDPVSFETPRNGWSVKREDLSNLVQNLSSAFALTGAESARLSYELNFAANKVDGQNLFVGVVDQKELSTKLPLEVSPSTVEVERIHFYVGESKTQHVNAPKVSPVKRGTSYVLEIGASAGM